MDVIASADRREATRFRRADRHEAQLTWHADRGVSTVFDALVFVLLVGAAIAVLAGIPPQSSGGDSRVADETADVLATSTTTVEFTRSGRVTQQSLYNYVGEGSGPPPAESADRRAHGTYAELLAAAATTDPELDGLSLTASGNDFEDATAGATRQALSTDAANIQVRATWRAYPGATLSRTVVVGEEPPPGADVSVATVTVASGYPNVTERLGPDPTVDDVADAVARSVVSGLFPVDQTRDALAGEGVDRAFVASRYQTASERLDVQTAALLGEGQVAAANDRLATALSDDVSGDLSGEFDSGDAAAGAIETDEVRIVVRTWSG
jgi:hypothetical protein